jgi:hypothetical protein
LLCAFWERGLRSQQLTTSNSLLARSSRPGSLQSVSLVFFLCFCVSDRPLSLSSHFSSIKTLRRPHPPDLLHPHRPCASVALLDAIQGKKNTVRTPFPFRLSSPRVSVANKERGCSPRAFTFALFPPFSTRLHVGYLSLLPWAHINEKPLPGLENRDPGQASMVLFPLSFLRAFSAFSLSLRTHC